MKKNIQKIIISIGYLIILFIILDILTTTILQIINIPMSSANLIISTILTVIVFAFFKRKDISKHTYKIYIISIIITTFIVAISTYIIGKTFDTTCDGNFYHKTAIGLIKEGWNPLYQNAADFCEKSDSEIEDKGQFLWIDHYPKASWNFAASIYAITNNIESGKVITLLLLISLSCLTYSYFSEKKLKKWQSILLAVIIAINPIAMSQLFSYYVDSIMGLSLYGIILFLIMITDKNYTLLSKKEKWIGLACEIILCMNIKFTGVYFAAIFSLMFYALWIIELRKEENFAKKVWKITLNFIIIVIIGIGIVGSSTYIKNTIDHKNPLYPLMGKGKVDIVTTMQPESFGYKNRVIKLIESTFAISENITYTSGDSPKFKIPFSIAENEINNIAIPDIRIGGYGIFFGGIVIFSIIILAYSLILIAKKEKKLFNNFIAIIAGIILSTLFMSEAWWARYSPQLYLIPILSLIGIFTMSNTTDKKNIIICNIIGIALTAIMIINTSFFIYWRVKDLQVFKNIKNSLVAISDSSSNLDDKISIAFNDTYYYGIIFNIRDKNVNYKIENNPSDEMKHYIYNYQMKY